MKTLVSISILLSFCQQLKAQENVALKDFVFENPGTKEKIKIETGSMVTVWLMKQETGITGAVLSFTDSSLTLAFQREPHQQMVPFRIISKLAVIHQVSRRYTVWVKLKNGERIKGELIRTTLDSVSLITSHNSKKLVLGASEIRTLNIRRRMALGRAIGIGTVSGGAVGAIIGYATYTPPEPCTNTAWCINIDLGPGFSAAAGAVLGLASGAVVGTLVGLTDQKFTIDGDRSRFFLFATEFKNQGLQQTSK